MGCHPTPVTAGIGVWLDGVGQAGMYRTAERMTRRTRLHRCREGIPVNNGTRIEGVLVRISSMLNCLLVSYNGRLSWLYEQLSDTRKYSASYRIVSYRIIVTR